MSRRTIYSAVFVVLFLALSAVAFAQGASDASKKPTPVEGSASVVENRLADVLEKVAFLVLGAFLSLTGIIYQNYHASKREEKVTVVRRLEEIFTLSEEAVRWGGEMMRPIGDALSGRSREPSSNPIRSPVQRISMLARLYEPDLIGAAKPLREACEELSKLHGDILLESMQRGVRHLIENPRSSTGEKPMLDLGPKTIGEMVRIVADITNRSKELNLAIESAMKKYI